MTLNLFNIEQEYEKEKQLKKNEVQSLMDWVRNQPHLPEINEHQAILFLQSCRFSKEAAQLTINSYITTKMKHQDLFLDRNPINLKEELKTVLITPLPKKTPQDYTVFLVKIMDSRVNKFNFPQQVKHFDMICMAHLYQQGTSAGHLLIVDMNGIVFGHLFKLGPIVLKRFLDYFQESMPIRWEGLHLFNTSWFANQLVGLVKPFLNERLWNMVHIHKNVDGLLQHVPFECLPSDYGGSLASLNNLSEKMGKMMLDSTQIFQWEDSLRNTA